jgi:hypothetical protein
MKTAGIILLVLGLLMTIYSGYTYVTKEKVLDIGGIEITSDKEHTINWQPYVGLGIIVIGGTVLVMSKKKLILA